MAKGVYKVTEEFEEELSKYTGAPYVITVDNASNALFLALKYENVEGKDITIPKHTYPSVPCEIIHAGGKVDFWERPVDFCDTSRGTLTGAYQLYPSKVWDAALSFTYNMYKPNTHMCVSFTGPYKHFKLSKGGAILTDDPKAARWFKRARYSGRRECSYHEDNLDMLGWNFYMEPEKAARGLLLMRQFYDMEGKPVENKDLELPYPDLSKFPIYTQS